MKKKVNKKKPVKKTSNPSKKLSKINYGNSKDINKKLKTAVKKLAKKKITPKVKKEIEKITEETTYGGIPGEFDAQKETERLIAALQVPGSR